MAPDTHSSSSLSTGAPAPEPRLRLAPAPHPGAALDGGWWPVSAEPAAELPGLVLALDRLRGAVRRIELGIRGWQDKPARIEAGGREVGLAWSTETPPDLVVAIGLDGTRTRLLVVPPFVGAFTASAALDLAALATNTAGASAVMDAASRLVPPPGTGPEVDWESEGGGLYNGTGLPRRGPHRWAPRPAAAPKSGSAVTGRRSDPRVESNR